MKLRETLPQILDMGARVLAISSDLRDDAARMAAELGPHVVVLSDPAMRVIVLYGMKAHNMAMAEMGYVVIDAGGRIRARRIDREMGEHAQDIIKAVRQSAAPAA